MLHQYQMNGYSIVLDVYSGAVHVVDEVAYDVIARLGKSSPDEIVAALAEKYADRPEVTPDEIRACLDEVEALRAAGQLDSPDPYAAAADRFQRRPGVVKALCLHVAHTCNLDCSYCFASQGKYHGARALMSFDVGKQALDFLVAKSGDRVNLEVDFFGGEPLMNWDVVKRLVAYARSIEAETHKKFRFTLTTNGVLVDDEVIDFANREMHNVVMSIDGRKFVHDRFRVDCAGNGSYDRVVPKFQKFAAARGDREYYVRGTYTHYNTDFTADLLHLADLGFDRLAMEPVVCPPGDPCALTDDDLPVLLAQYEALATEMHARERAGRPFTFYHYMLDLAHGPCIYKRIAGCGAGTEYLAVTPTGDLYPCHQFVGEPRFRLGDVWQGVTDRALTDEFARCNVYARPACADCWARLYCSGGCAANAYHASGSITGAYEYGCKLFRKRLECAVWLQVAARYAPDGAPRDSAETT